jgi:Invasion associated locus B (IalB) protein
MSRRKLLRVQYASIGDASNPTRLDLDQAFHEFPAIKSVQNRTACRGIRLWPVSGGSSPPLRIVDREGDATARLQVFSPVGMYLPKPAKLTIDQGDPHSVPYTWCLTNACIAGTVADPKMVKEMDSGRTPRLEFVESNLLLLTTSLPLAQFASIHKGAPTQTLEQDIDE